MAEHIKQATPSEPTDALRSAIGSDTRQREIPLSACYQAQASGFAAGSELEDWLDAALSDRR